MQQITEGRESLVERFSAGLARDDGEVRQAQRLRYRVFVEEFGASIPYREEGLDCDEFDPYCDHLLVRDVQTGQVVGTYRVLTAANAQRAGGFYSEREFHIPNLARWRSRIVEIGRACVDPEYRSGIVIVKLWAALTRLILARGYEYVIGCGSVPLHDGGRLASSIYHALRGKCLSPEEWRVFPRVPFPLAAIELDPSPALPALVKGYLRLGAYLCGEPAWDREFKTADLPLMLPMARMDRRYVERFLRS